MNSYTTKQTSLTASNAIIYTIFASQFVGGWSALEVQDGGQQGLSQLPYEVNASLPSYDQIEKLNFGSFSNDIDQQLVTAVSSFYAQLIERQESLGNEFEQVLHQNLWDLYER